MLGSHIDTQTQEDTASFSGDTVLWVIFVYKEAGIHQDPSGYYPEIPQRVILNVLPWLIIRPIHSPT